VDANNLLSNADVVNKYHVAADLANEVMKRVLQAVVPGARVVDVCKLGDDLIADLASRIFKKGNKERGIAFPTCLSVNNVIKNNSPLPEDSTHLSAGDLVKIDLGVHIDGYVATLAHTTLINVNGQQPMGGRTADVVCAAYYAAEIAARMIRVGTSSSDITKAIEQVAAAYGCTPVRGSGSPLLKRYISSSSQIIPSSSEDSEGAEPFTILESEVYAIDVLLSTGTGSPRQHPDAARPHILQRDVNVEYPLKLKSARAAVSEASKKFGVFPFPVRTLVEGNPACRIGVQECVSHGVLVAHPVQVEAHGERVAHFKLTVLVLPSGTMRIT
ncbi:peptidase M24, structural domain-containing protein, partial [Blyttiomyces helicus]